ncbi:MAG: hypothetical protein R6V76_07100 [Desulfobacterales bacterium]
MKIPITTAVKSNCLNFRDIIRGIANIRYRKKIVNSDNITDFFFDSPIFNVIDSPIKIKFIILKTEPRMTPLPNGLRSSNIKKRPPATAKIIALEQYFF